MLLSAPELDVSDSEARIKALLASAQDLDDDVHDVCWHFGDILMRVLRSSPGDREWRYWSLDDLVPKSVSRSGNVMTLSGLAWWLSGGDGCQRFRLDVALDTEPLLYSYKFLDDGLTKQVLYVGKRPDGWLLNGN